MVVEREWGGAVGCCECGEGRDGGKLRLGVGRGDGMLRLGVGRGGGLLRVQVGRGGAASGELGTLTPAYI